MNAVILEFGHFQYAITQAEIFLDHEVTIVTTSKMKGQMLEYAEGMSSTEIHVVDGIAAGESEIKRIIHDKLTDILLVSPVFTDYSALLRILKTTKCTKVLTTHNINTWFKHRFWSPNSFLDKVHMKSILRNCDYIAVEDFIFNYLQKSADRTFLGFNFVYIPFTIFHEGVKRKYDSENSGIKVVLTGAIDGDRRRYELVLDLIGHYLNRSNEITFSFAGRAKGDYGKMIQNKLRELKSVNPDIVSFFDDNSTADMFRREMETSDLVLSTSTKTFRGMGTVEYIGKTKPTAAIHDMMTYELPGFLPDHLEVPKNLRGSVFNYRDLDQLIGMIDPLLDDRKKLHELKAVAQKNSLNFTAEKIRAGLPF